jgi:hypothetical protein
MPTCAPIRSPGAEAYLAADARAEELRVTQPLIATETVDRGRFQLCAEPRRPARETASCSLEIFRVLRNGGRAVISDIVSDEPVPEELQNDPELWSGCISGALTEERFLQAFVDAGFYGVSHGEIRFPTVAHRPGN